LKRREIDMTTSVVPTPEREDWSPLAAILDKALAAISEPERNVIYRKWLPLRYEPILDYTQLWYALAGFVPVFLALLVWIRKLSRAIDLRKAREAELRARNASTVPSRTRHCPSCSMPRVGPSS
jgi:hypothetical protein